MRMGDFCVMAFIKWSFGDIRAYPNLVEKFPDFEFSDAWLISHKSDFVFPTEYMLENSTPFPEPCASNESGVYILFANGAVSYVGQANNLERRIETHSDRLHGKGKDFDRYFVIAVPHYFINDVECHYITTLSPPGNIAKGRGAWVFR